MLFRERFCQRHELRDAGQNRIAWEMAFDVTNALRDFDGDAHFTVFVADTVLAYATVLANDAVLAVMLWLAIVAPTIIVRAAARKTDKITIAHAGTVACQRRSSTRWVPICALALACGAPTASSTSTTSRQSSRAAALGYPAPLGNSGLRSPGEFRSDFMIEHRVTIAHRRGRHSFRAVLQKKGAEVLLVGLAPHGGRAFLLSQRGTQVRFRSWMPFEMPFPPRYILYDIHRIWLQPVSPSREGTQRRIAFGEEVAERFANGRLVRRTFRRVDNQPPGHIVVNYAGGLDVAAPCRSPGKRIEFSNGWFGYRTSVDVRVCQPL